MEGESIPIGHIHRIEIGKLLPHNRQSPPMEMGDHRPVNNSGKCVFIFALLAKALPNKYSMNEQQDTISASTPTNTAPSSK
jgi:hypothetical protein